MNGMENARDLLLGELSMKWRFQLGFKIPTEDPRGPDVVDPTKTPHDSMAVTAPNRDEMHHADINDPAQYPNGDTRKWGIFTWIDVRSVETLRRKDLNVSEKMSIEWNLASTVSIVS